MARLFRRGMLDKQIDDKCGENTTLACLLKIVFNGIKDFEEYWYYKDAKKTNAKLQDLSIDFSLILDGLLGDPQESEFVAFQQVLGTFKLYKHRDRLVKELVIPPKADFEIKDRLRETRQEIINAWTRLGKAFSWEELKEKLPAELISSIEEH